jgi:hypothetical protein
MRRLRSSRLIAPKKWRHSTSNSQVTHTTKGLHLGIHQTQKMLSRRHVAVSDG